MYFNFVHGFINYLCTIFTNFLKKICLRLTFFAAVTYFYFVQDFMNYFWATVENSVKKFACGGFRYFCNSISFTIPLIILCATVTNAVKKIRLRRAFGALVGLFQFPLFSHTSEIFLPTSLLNYD